MHHQCASLPGAVKYNTSRSILIKPLPERRGLTPLSLFSSHPPTTIPSLDTSSTAQLRARTPPRLPKSVRFLTYFWPPSVYDLGPNYLLFGKVFSSMMPLSETIDGPLFLPSSRGRHPFH
jgi:hypothetical protein